jgi:hypothetical protein
MLYAPNHDRLESLTFFCEYLQILRKMGGKVFMENKIDGIFANSIKVLV